MYLRKKSIQATSCRHPFFALLVLGLLSAGACTRTELTSHDEAQCEVALDTKDGWVVCREDHFRAKFPVRPERDTQRVTNAVQESKVTTLRARLKDGTVLIAVEQALQNTANLDMNGLLTATKQILATQYEILTDTPIKTQLGEGADLELRAEHPMLVRIFADAPGRRIYTFIARTTAATPPDVVPSFMGGFEPL